MNSRKLGYVNEDKGKNPSRNKKHLSHTMEDVGEQSSISDVNVTSDPTKQLLHINDSSDDLGRNEDLARVEIGTLAIILLVTIVGNSLVLLALYAKKCKAGKKTLSRMYFYIFHLCVADLITAFLNVLPQLFWDITYRFQGNQFLCKTVKYGQILGPYLSSYVLMATALDRYRAICYPLTYHSWSSRRSKTFVAYAWCISLAFAVPQLFIFSYIEIAPDVWDCWASFPYEWGEQGYVVWYSVSIFIVPLAGLIFTYTCICRVIWQNASTELGNQGQLISRAKINTIKQTIAVIAVYITCSLPFIVAQLWAVWDPVGSVALTSGPLFTIVMLLSSLNSCANPWIFMVFNSDLFFSLRLLFGGKQAPLNQSLRHSNSDSSNTVNTSRKKNRISKLGCPMWRKPSLSDTDCSINQDQLEMKRWVANIDENGTTTTEIATSQIPLEFR